MKNVIIETKELTKRYGTINAVDNLNLEVYDGEIFGLLGPNGAGKTTTVRLLNCIIRPTSGTASVNGFDTVKNSVDVKRVTGNLAESPGLYEKLSASEYLEFVGALYELPDEVLSKRIIELLKLFGLFERKDYLLEGFSRGMRQKVLIAAAIIHDPRTVFLDEPTSTLDPSAAVMVKDLIKGLAGEAGKTVFICSHILPVVEELCDRIGIIIGGRLVTTGTVDEIISRSGKDTLEEAYIAITGGIEKKELFAWREMA